MDQLKEAVKEFFKFLDYTEESDSGRVFHPISLGCCRAMMSKPLGDCLEKMKRLANEPPNLPRVWPTDLG